MDDSETRFLERLWRDAEFGALASEADYMREFPECVDVVQREYRAVQESLRDCAAAEAEPRQVGRYRVERLLGRGGMGVLFVGHDPELDRRVVIKTLRDEVFEDGSRMRRLRREARIAGSLQHEGICPVLDVVEDSGRAHIIMPFVEGETLGARLRRCRDRGDDPEALWASLGVALSGDLRHALRWVEEVAIAVHEAHEAGIVHRDLKPDNLMIRPDARPLVLDFGLALDLSVEASTRLTRDGQGLGTPDYMAPEQIEGRLDRIDRRVDVWALGVVLYEVLTLTRPFAGPTLAATIERIRTQPLVAPRRTVPTLPRDLDQVAEKALSRDLVERYATAAELAEDLRRVRTLRPTIAQRPGTATRVWRYVRRRPLVAACAALAALAAVSIGWAARAHAAQERERERGDRLGAEVLELTELFDRATEAARSTPPGDLLARPLDECRTRLQALRDQCFPETRSARGGEPALLHPRAAVCPPLVFRFRPGPGAPAREWLLELDLAAGVPLVGDPDASGVVTLSLPADPTVAAGEHVWSVRPGGGSSAPGSPHASFELRPAADREAVLAAVAPTGTPAVDRLLRAASLVAAGFAADGLDELDGYPADAPPQLLARCEMLRAEARALLRDRDGFDSASARVLAHVDAGRDPVNASRR